MGSWDAPIYPRKIGEQEIRIYVGGKLPPVYAREQRKQGDSADGWDPQNYP